LTRRRPRAIERNAFSEGRQIVSMKPNGGEDSLFRRMNSLFWQKNSLFRTPREFVHNTLELLRDFASGTAEKAEKLQNSLLFSLLSGNSRIKAIRPPADRLTTSH
jgi:hypothetical protein